MSHRCQGCRDGPSGCCCVGCSQQPALPSVPAGALPAAQPSLGITFPLAQPQPHRKGFPLSIPYLLQHCLALGRDMGLWGISPEPGFGLFSSPSKYLHALVCKHCLSPVEVWGFLLTPYVPLVDKIWPVRVEIPACAAFFFSFFPPTESICCNFEERGKQH